MAIRVTRIGGGGGVSAKGGKEQRGGGHKVHSYID